MELRVLVDNNTFIDDYYYGEPGLSFYLEDEGIKILFDTGYSDIFIKNAQKMDIDLKSVNYIVLSHGHNDHTGGIQYLDKDILKNVKLVAHPFVFKKREHDGHNITCPVQLNDLKVKKYIDGSNIVQLTSHLYFLGHIERTTAFENHPVGMLIEENVPDYLEDDSALVYKGKKGLFIITACSHSGICNIVEYAKKIFNEEKIDGIIGGFHLLKNNDQLVRTIDYLKTQKIKELYPCHCVSLYAKHKMFEACNIKEVGVGLRLHIE